MMMVSLSAVRSHPNLKLVTLTTSTSTRPGQRFRPMINLKVASRSTRKSTRTTTLVLRSQSLKSLFARVETK
jgi:hypothetical protein